MSRLMLSCLPCVTVSPSRCLLLPAAGALSLLFFLGIFLLPSKQESRRKSLYCILQGFRWIISIWIAGDIFVYLWHVAFYFYACILPHFVQGLESPAALARSPLPYHQSFGGEQNRAAQACFGGTSLNTTVFKPRDTTRALSVHYLASGWWKCHDQLCVYNLIVIW